MPLIRISPNLDLGIRPTDPTADSLIEMTSQTPFAQEMMKELPRAALGETKPVPVVVEEDLARAAMNLASWTTTATTFQPIIVIMVGTGSETLEALKMKVTTMIIGSILPQSSDKLLGRAQQGG